MEEFKNKVPELGAALLEIIEQETKTNKRFIQAFEDFAELCKAAINPNLSRQAVEEMLIQHLLTERIFSKVFDNPEFVNRNIIAREIEQVINALTSPYFSKHEFLKKLDRFYVAIETTAATIDDYRQKQSFLNTVYEKFFQGFSVKVADTHGIVYTPQPIVDFMVKSVEEILHKEFGRSLSDNNVHILDPFVGTGNFIIRIMREIKKTALPYKYANELHCNEVMLLPYYIASMNIEHEFYELTAKYQPFEGICLVDTFELAEAIQTQMAFMTAENMERVEKLKKTPIFIIIGNPPYNVGQINENDNNKNRKYKEMDRRVHETYTNDSKASNKNALSDIYVKAFRWASDRIIQNKEGIIAFVSNNSFIEDFAFDGFRKHLVQDFNRIYILNLKGNVRKDSMREGIPIGEKHTIFGLSAMVGISVCFLIRTNEYKTCKIFYSSVDWKATRLEKFNLIEKAQSINQMNWKEINPDIKFNWLTEGLKSDFETFLPIGTKENKIKKFFDVKSIFKIFSIGVSTNRDAWAYNYNKNELEKNIKDFIKSYNIEVDRWRNNKNKSIRLDDFVLKDEKKIKWSSRLKECLRQYRKAEFKKDKIRNSIYRPYSFQFLFFDEILTHRRGRLTNILPKIESESENKLICVTAVGNKKTFQCLMVNMIPDLHLTGDSQCFPFYTYKEDGKNRKENITEWALAQFRENYKDTKISQWDIFYYVYGMLHHPKYREKYAANLRRELPRIPFAPDFSAFADAGKKLAELHVNYEQQEEYPLEMIENKDMPLNWRVEKMKLNRDRTQIIYNDFLTLAGIPAETFKYRLGNRSAMEWIIDQYQVKTDKRSGITNDPNREDDPEYIVRLIKKIVTVSLETVKIVKGLPGFEESK